MGLGIYILPVSKNLLARGFGLKPALLTKLLYATIPQKIKRELVSTNQNALAALEIGWRTLKRLPSLAVSTKRSIV